MSEGLLDFVFRFCLPLLISCFMPMPPPLSATSVWGDATWILFSAPASSVVGVTKGFNLCFRRRVILRGVRTLWGNCVFGVVPCINFKDHSSEVNLDDV